MIQVSSRRCRANSRSLNKFFIRLFRELLTEKKQSSRKDLLIDAPRCPFVVPQRSGEKTSDHAAEKSTTQLEK